MGRPPNPRKDDRHKTDLRLPRPLYAQLEVLAKDHLGISINAFFTLAVGQYLGFVAERLPGKKRHELLASLDAEIQKVFDKYRQ